jgi:glycosyltransferase involved in cell wall biosynthesis
LAHDWGFDKDKPRITLPGNGGIDLNLFYPPPPQSHSQRPATVINPRGIRAYVRNDTFFNAIPLVLEKYPQTRFICPAMADHPGALPYLNRLQAHHLDYAVQLLPNIPRNQMADLFRKADIAVSPSEHDGTPNTLLEALACGCLPIAGDIESLGEWINPVENGLLFDPSDHQALAPAIIQGLENENLRNRAAKENARLIEDRAEYKKSMKEAENFYIKLQPHPLP